VAGSDGDAKAAHHIGIGAQAVGGSMQGSYLEFGYGKTDLFIVNRDRRYKFDGCWCGSSATPGSPVRPALCGRGHEGRVRFDPVVLRPELRRQQALRRSKPAN
jgi:hypothetical protein